ncbi:hypothetical protein HK104_000494 [Borealophlyctis nickersoniae]|nr:hypothetical protein HK104_000494 [Borealophlyctis nickersoniae]
MPMLTRTLRKPSQRALSKKFTATQACRRLNNWAGAKAYKFPIQSIQEVLDTPPTQGNDIAVHGWVRSVRSQKTHAFVEVNDGSTVRGLQALMNPEDVKRYRVFGCVNAPHYVLFDWLISLHTGCSVRLVGQLVKSPGKEQATELSVSSCELLGPADPDTYPLHKARLSMDYLREHAHLRSRSKTFGAVWRIRNAAILGVQHFFQVGKAQKFFQVHTPLITSNDCEGAGEVFRVLTNESLKSYQSSTCSLSSAAPASSSSPPLPSEFFSHPVYLTVSGQLHAELLATALSRVYTLGPTFRAEKSLSTRHLAEFWMLEAEMAFITSTTQLLDVMEALLREVAAYVQEHALEDVQFLGKWVDKTLEERLMALTKEGAKPFGRISYTEAVEILKGVKRKWDHPVEWGLPLQSEHERYLAEEHYRGPVFVTDYPARIKPFYMLDSIETVPDGRTVACVDLLVPRIGELAGGSLREDSADKLIEKMKQGGLNVDEYGWYIDLRRFGSVPHGGFGIGFERLLAYFTGVWNVRDLIVAPRFYSYCKY